MGIEIDVPLQYENDSMRTTTSSYPFELSYVDVQNAEERDSLQVGAHSARGVEIDRLLFADYYVVQYQYLTKFEYGTVLTDRPDSQAWALSERYCNYPHFVALSDWFSYETTGYRNHLNPAHAAVVRISSRCTCMPWESTRGASCNEIKSGSGSSSRYNGAIVQSKWCFIYCK